MSDHLWLDEPRDVVTQPGLGLHFDFGPGRQRAVRELLASGYLTLTNAYYEPVGGYILGLPDYTLTSMAPANWTQVGSWAQAQSSLTPSGGAVTWLTNSATDWSLEDVTAPTAGQGRYVCLIAYESREDAGGVGTGSPITLTIAGRWKMELADDGQAILYRKGVTADTVLAQFDWMTAQRFADAQGTPHWLWIYEARQRLVIRNLSPSLEGRLAGLAYTDPAPLPDPLVTESDGTPIYHALPAAKWKIAGTGHVTVNLSPAGYVPGAAAVAGQLAAIEGGSTVKCQLTPSGTGIGVVVAETQPPVAATATATTDSGTEYPQGTGTFVDPAYGISWRVDWTTPATGTATYALAAMAVKVPILTRSDGLTGVDLLATAGVADRSITVAREGDLTRETLRAELFTAVTGLASYVRTNAHIRYVTGTTTRFRGLLSRPAWAELRGDIGTLTLEAEGLWRRFRKALWPGGQPFDGRLLTDCLAEVVEAAGIASTGYELATVSYRFPTAQPGEAPALVYRPGTPIDRILEDLRSKWYGSSLYHYFRLSDGKFVLASTTAGSSVATFYTTNLAAQAAGADLQTIRAGTYREALDDTEQYNAVAVIGQDRDGRPLLAKAVDWASIRDSSVWNYTGEPWWLIVSDPGLATQAAVNWVCRALFNAHRYPRVFAEWQSCRVDVWPGEVVTIGATSYVLKGVSLTRSADGPGAQALGIASYQAQKVV